MFAWGNVFSFLKIVPHTTFVTSMIVFADWFDITYGS